MRNPESFKKSTTDLKSLFEADQSDRISELWKTDPELMNKRDDERLEKVLELVNNDKLISGSDYLKAAMLLQHGTETNHYEMAHELAKKAAAMDYQPIDDEPDPLWLAAATKDRALMSADKPQLYGTQYIKNKDDKWVLWEVDNSLSDDERAKMHVDSLEESTKFVDEMNKEENE